MPRVLQSFTSPRQISVVRRSYQRSAYCILWLRLTIHQFNGLRPVSNLGAVLVQFPLKTTEQLEGALALPRAVSSYRSRRRYRSDNLSREQFGDSFSKRDDEVEKSTAVVRAVFEGSVPACTPSPSLVSEYCYYLIQASFLFPGIEVRSTYRLNATVNLKAWHF